MKNAQNVIAKPDVKQDTIGMPQHKPVILNARQVINMMNPIAHLHNMHIANHGTRAEENIPIARHSYFLMMHKFIIQVMQLTPRVKIYVRELKILFRYWIAEMAVLIT